MPRVTNRARALRDLRRLQEYRLLNRVVNILTADSSISSGGLGTESMEDEMAQAPAGEEQLCDLSGAWPSLLSPHEIVEKDCGYSADCGSYSSSCSDSDREEEAFLDNLLEATILSISSSRYFESRSPRRSLQRDKWRAILNEGYYNEEEFLRHFRCDMPSLMRPRQSNVGIKYCV